MRARNLRKAAVVVRASSISDSVDGVNRNLIPDETRKMSDRVGAFRRVLPTLKPETQEVKQRTSL